MKTEKAQLQTIARIVKISGFIAVSLIFLWLVVALIANNPYGLLFTTLSFFCPLFIIALISTVVSSKILTKRLLNFRQTHPHAIIPESIQHPISNSILPGLITILIIVIIVIWVLDFIVGLL